MLAITSNQSNFYIKCKFLYSYLIPKSVEHYLQHLLFLEPTNYVSSIYNCPFTIRPLRSLLIKSTIEYSETTNGLYRGDYISLLSRSRSRTIEHG